jgi:hypothetical protein
MHTYICMRSSVAEILFPVRVLLFPVTCFAVDACKGEVQHRPLRKPRSCEVPSLQRDTEDVLWLLEQLTKRAIEKTCGEQTSNIRPLSAVKLGSLSHRKAITLRDTSGHLA